MTPDRPVLLLSVFPTFRVGGAQVRFAAIANHFGRRIRHVIAAMDHAFDCKERLNRELDVTLLPLTFRKGDTLANARLFRSLLRSLGPDTLATYNWGTIEWAMANWPRLTRHVHVEDGFGPEEVYGQLRRRVLTRRLALSRSRVIVPSRTLERIALDVWKIARPRLQFIPNGIDCGRFSDPSVKPYPVAGTGPVVGTVTALRPEKNIGRLLDAFAAVRRRMPCRLLIAGDGPVRGALETLAQNLGIAGDVTFAGHVGDAERIYAAMDVFALSSDTEQMPISVLEAMAAGLPVAATDVGDIRLMVAPQNSRFVAGRDSGALAEALLPLLNDRQLRGRIGASNRDVVQARFGQEAMINAYGESFGVSR